MDGQLTALSVNQFNSDVRKPPSEDCSEGGFCLGVEKGVAGNLF
uniref:Uncharacterized protein n=1 Tax=Desertifilum tharense IPPAS B-1220 TaxID=1781255 RepID=A0ACD5GTI7_9CYAN